MTKTKLDEAYQRGVKSGQEAGLVDSVFHDMGNLVANTVIGASGLSVAEEAEAEEKGYQYGIIHRASPTSKKDDSYVSSSSCSSDYDESSSGDGILWLAFLVAGFLGVCMYDNKRIADAKENAAISRPVSKDEVNLRKYDLSLSKTEPTRIFDKGAVRFTTGGRQVGENVSLSSLTNVDHYKKFSSNKVTQRNGIVYKTNMLERKLSGKNVEVNLVQINSEGENSYVIDIRYDVQYNNQEIHGGQKLIQSNEHEKSNAFYASPTNAFRNKRYDSQELHGAQKLMQLKKRSPPQKP